MLIKFLLISCNLALAFFGQNQLPVFPSFPEDMYPSRVEIERKAFEICGELQSDAEKGRKNLPQKLGDIFQNTKSVKLINSNSDETRLKYTIDASAPVLAQVLYEKSAQSFSLSITRSANEIEAISYVSLTKNCAPFQAFHTFYNQAKRPFLRIKTNSFGYEILNIKMEEPPLPFETSANGKLKIGIIDSGIDYNHERLISKSRPLIGIDLKNLGRPPFDYTNSIQNELMGRTFYHGTAVADIASRDIDVHVVPVRIENQSSAAGDAVEFLAKNNVRLVNLSQGSWNKDDWENFKTAVLRHPEMLFIVAAGNESTNIDDEPSYPAAFELPNMLVVASVSKDGSLSSFSNYGSGKVHVAANGENILAAQAGGGYRELSGTSFAAPQVTRLAAKLLLKSPHLNATELKNKIIRSTRMTPSLSGKVKFGALPAGNSI